MPIFHEIQKIDTRFQFHCLQFIPTDNTQNQQIASKQFNIPYVSARIQKKTMATLGSLWTLFHGHKENRRFFFGASSFQDINEISQINHL